jgi:hypothetical protein
VANIAVAGGVIDFEVKYEFFDVPNNGVENLGLNNLPAHTVKIETKWGTHPAGQPFNRPVIAAPNIKNIEMLTVNEIQSFLDPNYSTASGLSDLIDNFY